MTESKTATALIWHQSNLPVRELYLHMKHDIDRIFSVPTIDLLCWKCRAILQLICIAITMEWGRVETSKTLFYLKTVTWRDAPIQRKYNYWTKFPLSGVHMANQHKRKNAVPCNKYKLYINYFIQWQQSNGGALDCSVTVMDGINTQFLGKCFVSRICIMSEKWASVHPQYHKFIITHCSVSFPAESSRRNDYRLVL